MNFTEGIPSGCILIWPLQATSGHFGVADHLKWPKRQKFAGSLRGPCLNILGNYVKRASRCTLCGASRRLRALADANLFNFSRGQAWMLWLLVLCLVVTPCAAATERQAKQESQLVQPCIPLRAILSCFLLGLAEQTKFVQQDAHKTKKQKNTKDKTAKAQKQRKRPNLPRHVWPSPRAWRKKPDSSRPTWLAEKSP